MKRVLLVEDEESIRELVKELLELEGYAVQCAVNGDEGLNALRGSDVLPGVVLLDMTMPVKDGFQFRKEQAEDPKLAGVPVVVMTADGNIESKTKSLGGSAFLRKPFNADQLVDLVRQYCN